MSTSLTIGADPELMLVDANNIPRSSLSILKGRKANPELIEKGFLMSDNVLPEFGIDPAQEEDEFVENIKTVLSILNTRIGALSLVARPSARFPEDELKSREAQVFGCDPDFDAYTVQINHVAEEAAFDTFRTAGAHVHVGHPFFLGNPWGVITGVKMLDAILGIPATVIDNKLDSKERRNLYGRAGSHRIKPEYGFEYRVLSNWWVARPDACRLVYKLTAKAVELTVSKKTDIIKTIGEDTIQRVINESATADAKKLVRGPIKDVIGDDLARQILKMRITLKHRDIKESWNI